MGTTSGDFTNIRTGRVFFIQFDYWAGKFENLPVPYKWQAIIHYICPAWSSPSSFMYTSRVWQGVPNPISFKYSLILKSTSPNAFWKCRLILTVRADRQVYLLRGIVYVSVLKNRTITFITPWHLLLKLLWVVASTRCYSLNDWACISCWLNAGPIIASIWPVLNWHQICADKTEDTCEVPAEGNGKHATLIFFRDSRW